MEIPVIDAVVDFDIDGYIASKPPTELGTDDEGRHPAPEVLGEVFAPLEAWEWADANPAAVQAVFQAHADFVLCSGKPTNRWINRRYILAASRSVLSVCSDLSRTRTTHTATIWDHWSGSADEQDIMSRVIFENAWCDSGRGKDS